MAEIIFGIDHGNGNMKGSNVDFPCGLVRYTSEPGRFMNEDILEYQGTFYTLSETRMPFKADKTVDEDYFIWKGYCTWNWTSTGRFWTASSWIQEIFYGTFQAWYLL